MRTLGLKDVQCEWTDESVLWNYGYIEKMENSGIGKKVYEWECMVSHPISQPYGKGELIQ